MDASAIDFIQQLQLQWHAASYIGNAADYPTSVAGLAGDGNDVMLTANRMPLKEARAPHRWFAVPCDTVPSIEDCTPMLLQNTKWGNTPAFMSPTTVEGGNTGTHNADIPVTALWVNTVGEISIVPGSVQWMNYKGDALKTPNEELTRRLAELGIVSSGSMQQRIVGPVTSTKLIETFRDACASDGVNIKPNTVYIWCDMRNMPHFIQKLALFWGAWQLKTNCFFVVSPHAGRSNTSANNSIQARAVRAMRSVYVPQTIHVDKVNQAGERGSRKRPRFVSRESLAAAERASQERAAPAGPIAADFFVSPGAITVGLDEGFGAKLIYINAAANTIIAPPITINFLSIFFLL